MTEDENKDIPELDDLFKELEESLYNSAPDAPSETETTAVNDGAEEQPVPLSHSRRKKKDGPEEKMTWQETVMVYLHDIVCLLSVLMIVFVLFFRIVVVSGSSMYSTLWNGDYLLVMSSVLYGEPEYGDIIVASKDSFNDGEPIIKRVIATEGQTVDIDFDAGIVYVDGVALEEDYTYTLTTVSEGMEFPLTVEEGCVFAMGDNRARSRDSRYPDIGLIDEREILGRAVYLFYPGTGEGDNEASRDFSRIGALN